MIDPQRITRYDQAHEQLEEVLLFWVCAAGHNAKSSAKALDNFLRALHIITNAKPYRPFEALRKYKGCLPNMLMSHSIGCYNLKAKTFMQLAYSNLNLRTCSAEDLEEITGIGPKTSRCFILHSRRNAAYAGLDTHVLKYLRDQGYDAPTSTPASKKQYRKWELVFLELAEQANMSPADMDLAVWNQYSPNGIKEPA